MSKKNILGQSEIFLFTMAISKCRSKDNFQQDLNTFWLIIKLKSHMRIDLQKQLKNNIKFFANISKFKFKFPAFFGK